MKKSNNLRLYLMIGILIPVLTLAYTTHQTSKELEKFAADVSQMYERSINIQDALQELNEDIEERHIEMP